MNDQAYWRFLFLWKGRANWYGPGRTGLKKSLSIIYGSTPSPQAAPQGKRWKEYLLEFIMIFLAVTMGFFARQIRERHMEKERLQNYFGSMVLDIESNRMALDSAIRLNTNMIRDYDAMARSFLTGGPSFDRAAFARQMGSIWCR